MEPTSLAATAHVIQLAVAPVFLLMGIGTLLGVLTNRLSRIIDRARVLQGVLPSRADALSAEIESALRTLSRRARLINRAITLATICAILICAVIAALFLGAFVGLDVSMPVGVVFVAAMAALIGCLVTFLREVQLATATLRIGPPNRGPAVAP